MRFLYNDFNIKGIPEDLQDAIMRYLNFINNGGNPDDDCYRTEILMELNFCTREKILSPEDIKRLKDYYVWEGLING
jgi:hypothetical protein